MKKISFFVLICCAFSQCIAQISKVDSLNTLIKTDQDDTNKINHLGELSREFMYINPDTAIILAQQALQLSTQIANSPLAANDTTIKKAAERGMSKSNGNLGVFYYFKGDYPMALKYQFTALEIRTRLNDQIGIASSCNNIGLAYQRQGDYPNALKFFFQSLQINLQSDNKGLVAGNLNNIGLVYDSQGDYTIALEYFFNAMRLNESQGNKIKLAVNFNNIGNVYYKQENYPKALFYYFKSLHIEEESGNDYGVASTWGNIGNIYQKQLNYTKALEFDMKALNMCKKLEDKSGMAYNLGNIGTIYQYQANYKEAEHYLLDALALSEEIEALDLIKGFSEPLSQVYAATHQYELAYKYHVKFSIAKDSLFNDEKSKDIGRLESKHQMEVDQMERERKAEEELKTKVQERERKNTLQYSGIIVILLLISILITFLGFIKVNPIIAKAVTFFAFLLFFEFLLVLLDPTVDRISGGEPAYKLLFNAVIAACIFPIHALFERILKNRLMKKN